MKTLGALLGLIALIALVTSPYWVAWAMCKSDNNGSLLCLAFGFAPPTP